MLWQLGVISSVLVFGIKVGLASGLANLSKKMIAAIAGAYIVGVLVLCQIASMFTSQITSVIYDYNSIFFIIMAIIMMGAGVFSIREWKSHQKNTTKATCFAVIAPCPCCFGTIVVTVLLVAPSVGLGVPELSRYVALGLGATIVIAYFASKYIVKIIKKPYPIVLGNFMFFLGLYFLVSSLVIPNIAKILGKSVGGGMNLISLGTLAIILVITGALFAAGLYINRKSSILK